MMHSPKQWCFIKCIEHSKTIQNCGVFYRLWRSREISPKSLSPIAVNQVLNTVSFIQSSWICRKQVVCFNYAYIQSRSKYIITICCFCNPLLCLDSWVVVLWLLARISDSYPSPLTHGDWPPGLDEAVVSWPHVSWPPDHRNSNTCCSSSSVLP